jgi:hypothetical protein
VSQQDQHPTTEQLSAFLDQQLTREEQVSCSSHLQDCKPCQSALDDLRRTVNLLRSLPQLEVPRSFALPADFNLTSYPNSDYHNDQMDHMIETQRDVKGDQQVERSTTKFSRKSPTPLRQTLRIVSALAAVIGLFLIISGFITTPQVSVSMSAAPALDSAKLPTSGQSQQASQAAAHGTNNSDSLGPISTPTVQTANTPEPQPTPTRKSPVGTNTTATGPTPSFLDFNQPRVRLLIGILLTILGSIGFALFMQRQKQRTIPAKKHSA